MEHLPVTSTFFIDYSYNQTVGIYYTDLLIALQTCFLNDVQKSIIYDKEKTIDHFRFDTYLSVQTSREPHRPTDPQGSKVCLRNCFYFLKKINLTMPKNKRVTL